MLSLLIGVSLDQTVLLTPPFSAELHLKSCVGPLTTRETEVLEHI